jgi:hypothetical protein
VEKASRPIDALLITPGRCDSQSDALRRRTIEVDSSAVKHMRFWVRCVRVRLFLQPPDAEGYQFGLHDGCLSTPLPEYPLRPPVSKVVIKGSGLL